jgi:HprK-related kinase B
MKLDVNTVAGLLQGEAQLGADTLSLALGDCTLQVRSNSDALITGLREYFSHVPTGTARPDIEVIAIEREAPDTGIAFVDWQREPGKTGRKDSYYDIPGGRVVRKVRTGMVFLQSETQRIAAGPCLEFDNQVINFINAQYMNWLQQRGWLICHSAALVYRGIGFGIAGFSGGGKSTLMLHLLDHDEIGYLTNDRLFVRREAGQTRALGIPKLPRINPGTIVHNARLQGLIPAERRAELLAMPAKELWQLEEKYDVHVEQVYGPGRVVQQAPLGGYLVLNWRRDSETPLRVVPVTLEDRRDLLAAIMKSPGPFYQYRDGSFHRDDAEFDEQAYLDALQGVAVYEVSGKIDFDLLVRRCLDELLVPEQGGVT